MPSWKYTCRSLLRLFVRSAPDAAGIAEAPEPGTRRLAVRPGRARIDHKHLRGAGRPRRAPAPAALSTSPGPLAPVRPFAAAPPALRHGGACGHVSTLHAPYS